MSVVMQRESTEYLYIGAFGDEPAVNQEVAFMTAGNRPSSSDWHEALLVNEQHPLWGDASSATDGDYFIAILVGEFGTGGVDLRSSDYNVWVRITDTTERPVRIVPEALEVR